MLQAKKSPETAQTNIAVAATTVPGATDGSARYMDYDDDRYEPGADTFSKEFLFTFEQDNSDKPLSATNPDVGVSQINPARSIPSTRQGSPYACGRKSASLRQDCITTEGSPHSCGKKSSSVRHEANIHVIESLNLCGKETRVRMEECPHLSGKIPVSVQQGARICAVGYPHSGGRKHAYVKKEARNGASENLSRSEESLSNIWGSGAPAAQGGFVTLFWARHEAPALSGHQEPRLRQEVLLN